MKYVFKNPRLEELFELVQKLGLETYNHNPRYFCIKGINGHTTTVNVNNTPFKESTEIDIKNHILQMGRDSLKMELNSLLDITKHH